MSRESTKIVNGIGKSNLPHVRQLFLILIFLSFSLLFVACGGNGEYQSNSDSNDYDFSVITDDSAPADTGMDDSTDPGTDDGTDPGTDDGTDPGTDDGTDPGTDDGTDPGTDDGTDPPTDPLAGEKIQIVKDILYTTYSGIGDSRTASQTASPFYNPMTSDLNELAVALALDTFQPEELNDIYQLENLISILEELKSKISNDALVSRIDVLMTNYQRENLIATIENLISKFREWVTAIRNFWEWYKIYPISQSAEELKNTLDYNEIANLLGSQDIADIIEDSISSIMYRLYRSDTRTVDSSISDLEDVIDTINSQMITEATETDLLGFFAALIVQGLVKDTNVFNYTDGNVNSTMTMAGLGDLLSSANTEITVTISADFLGEGFFLGPSSCKYTGSSDGSPDFEAVIIIGISDALSTVDIESVEVTAYDSLHAAYPTYNVNYEGWILSYIVNGTTPLNISLLPMIENLTATPGDYKDNLDYTVEGGFSVGGTTYDITEMSYGQVEQNDGTWRLSVNGSIPANLDGAGISVKVHSDMIKCSSAGLWYDSQLSITVGQDAFTVIFDGEGSAIIGDETLSSWQESLNPLN